MLIKLLLIWSFLASLLLASQGIETSDQMEEHFKAFLQDAFLEHLDRLLHCSHGKPGSRDFLDVLLWVLLWPGDIDLAVAPNLAVLQRLMRNTFLLQKQTQLPKEVLLIIYSFST